MKSSQCRAVSPWRCNPSLMCPGYSPVTAHHGEHPQPNSVVRIYSWLNPRLYMSEICLSTPRVEADIAESRMKALGLGARIFHHDPGVEVQSSCYIVDYGVGTSRRRLLVSAAGRLTSSSLSGTKERAAGLWLTVDSKRNVAMKETRKNWSINQSCASSPS